MTYLGRRSFLKGLAAAIPGSLLLPDFRALAAPLHKQVKITDVKVMIVNGSAPYNMVKIETDSGLCGLGEAYWGRGVKDVILGYLREIITGQDPLNIEPLYTRMWRYTAGAGAESGVTVTASRGGAANGLQTDIGPGEAQCLNHAQW